MLSQEIKDEYDFSIKGKSIRSQSQEHMKSCSAFDENNDFIEKDHESLKSCISKKYPESIFGSPLINKKEEEKKD